MKLLAKIILILCITTHAFGAQTQIAEISGMICISCQNMVKNIIKKSCPEANINISWKEEIAIISFERKSNVTVDQLEKIIIKTGFDVGKVVSVDKLIVDPKKAKKYLN